jgi:hypothetical protein
MLEIEGHISDSLWVRAHHLFWSLPKFGAIKLLLAHSCPWPACRIIPNDADIGRAPSAPTMVPQDRKGILGEEFSQDSLWWGLGWLKPNKVPPNDVLQEMKSMQEPHNHRDTKHLVGDGQEKRRHASRWVPRRRWISKSGSPPIWYLSVSCTIPRTASRSVHCTKNKAKTPQIYSLGIRLNNPAKPQRADNWQELWLTRTQLSKPFFYFYFISKKIRDGIAGIPDEMLLRFYTTWL